MVELASVVAWDACDSSIDDVPSVEDDDDVKWVEGEASREATRFEVVLNGLIWLISRLRKLGRVGRVVRREEGEGRMLRVEL